ncbi:MAG TPA: HAD family hydrolase [Bacteroidales bacterium]|nr:HAD family hydrolase [Bacteroidales bacterium]
MEENYSEYIARYLVNQSEILPEPTGMQPHFQADPDVRAVLFDIYGTLVISESGDIEESTITEENLRTALDEAGITINLNPADQRHILPGMLTRFKKEIGRIHTENRSDEKPYPEIDILEIWETILTAYKNENLLHLSNSLCIKCFTFVFEMLSNNIYPMPGMKDVIQKLADKGIPLGIISNAQFYTPVIMNFFLNNRLSEEELVEPFDPDLTVFSYQHMRSKPDLYLFERVKNTCMAKYGIRPEQILFVGNDMFRDIYPASKAGLKTALFAGDRRSLRLRTDKPGMDSVNADYIITDLLQILKTVN